MTKLSKEKILLVTQTDPKGDPVFEKWIDYGYHAAVMFKKVNLFCRIIRRLCLFLNNSLGRIWCNSWINELEQFDTLILHSNELSGSLPSYIERKYPKIRIIYWYWNKVNKFTNPQIIKHSRTEFWTFNESDCRKYDMRYNPQYLYYVDIEDDVEIKSDIIFIGHDHGRLEKIKKIEEAAKKENLICDFRIIPSDSENIPYKKTLEIVMTSKSILEINQSNQNGYTLRTLESLFLEKKLITDNKYVMQLPFYNENNIYILGEEKITIREFLNKKYDKSVSRFQKEYDIDAWINRFFENEKK